MGAYGHRLQVFQRGQQERNSSANMEPLLNQQQQPQQQQQQHTHGHVHY